MEKEEKDDGTSLITLRVPTEIKLKMHEQARAHNLSLSKFIVKTAMEPVAADTRFNEISEKVSELKSDMVNLNDKVDTITKLVAKILAGM